MADSRVYKRRRPERTDYYRMIESRFEELERMWPECFEHKYGYLRKEVLRAIYAFLDCGIPENGVARVFCDGCGRDYFVAYSCRVRVACPSCSTKRSILFGEKIRELVRPISPLHVTFSIPKILRRFFLHDRKLLVELSRCAWESLKTFLQAAVPEPQAVHAAVISTQAFGDYPNRFHLHLHVLCPDGCFYGQGPFRVAPQFSVKDLEKLFRVKGLTMLLRKRKITSELIRMLDGWRHSGFNVFAGERLQPGEEKSLENLAAYRIRATFSRKRMDYSPEQATVL